MVVGGMISRGFNMGLSCSIYVPAFYCSSLGVSQHWVSPKSGWLVLPMTKLRESQGLNVWPRWIFVTALFKSNQYLLHQFLSAMVQHQPRRGFSSWSQDDLVNPPFTDGFPSYKPPFSSGISVAILISGKWNSYHQPHLTSAGQAFGGNLAFSAVNHRPKSGVRHEGKPMPQPWNGVYELRYAPDLKRPPASWWP